MGNAVIYARYSSDNQRDASIDQQVKECSHYAMQKGHKIVRTYSDCALTGKTDKRPSFLRMIRDSAKREFEYVLVYSLDRFSRNKYDSAIYKQKLRENGVTVLSAMEHLTDDPTGHLMESILEGFAQYYSEELSQKIHRGLKDNAEKAIVNGSVPLGYRRGADGHAEIVPEEAEVVREIFRRVLEKEPLIRIADDLNRRGIKTKKGAHWNKSSFNRILSNERYIGVYLYKEHRIEGGFPIIVDKETFDSAQIYIKGKPKARGGTARRKCKGDTYLLTGKLYCGECDSPMSGISGTSKTNDLHYYYQCTKKRYEKGCHKKNVPRDLIEQKITRQIMEILNDDEILEWLADRAMEHLESERNTAEIEALRARLKEATRKRDNLLDAIEDAEMLPILKDRLKERQEEVRFLSARVEALEKLAWNDITKDMILSYLETLRDGDYEDKAFQEKLIDAFLIRAYVFDDGRLKLIFNCTKEHREVEISLEEFSRKEGKGEEDAKVRLSSSHLHSTLSRRTFEIYMIKGYFVCDVPNAV
jgi:DNA invertase Pin-like site-specific DNA recombinase